MGNFQAQFISTPRATSGNHIKNRTIVELQSSFIAASSLRRPQPTTSVQRERRNNIGSTRREVIGKKLNNAAATNAMKKMLSDEKAAKKKAQELNKIYKPGECMKYMKVEIHPTFLEKWYTDDVQREVSMGGAKILSSSELFDAGLVLWKRSVPPELVSREGQVEMTPPDERCDRGLYVITAEDAASYVLEHKLAQHVAQMRNMADVKLSLVIFGVQDYFKSAVKKTKDNVMTELDLEMAITDLMVSTGCDAVLVNQPNELALLISQFTKAIAEAPYKKAKHACDEQAEFYMRGDNKNCVPVDKDGIGLSRLWQQMMAVLPLCSLETSRAICAEYKSPLALFRALQQQDGSNTIANLGVSRAAIPGCRARRIGPEFARKLHTLLTAQDGNTLID